MYWATTTDPSGVQHFEVLDGQQRTLSLANYVAGKFSDANTRFFHGLPDDVREAFLNYELLVYVCEGEPSERLSWFERINVAGVKLEQQELRNAVYAGPWLSDAKKFFSRTNGPASQLAADLLAGAANRQDFLETALKWICDRQGLKKVDEYMGLHQQDPNANELVMYFRQVESWVRTLFPAANYRKQMDGLPWGVWFNKYGTQQFDAAKLEVQVSALMADDEVQSKAGIYAYVLSGDPRSLSLRQFTPAQKATMFERQVGLCARPTLTGHDARTVFALKEMDGDHIIPWSQGGKTELVNGQMLCRPCNQAKSNS